MGVQEVREYLKQFNKDKDIIELDQSTATVELAAQALGTAPARIAKSLAFQHGEEAMVIVVAGDAKIDNKKFKKTFGFKAKMLSPENTLYYTGHEVGGVCPFDLANEIPVFLDQSMERFETMFPACGSGNSAIELSLSQLEKYAKSERWIDVCKDW